MNDKITTAVMKKVIQHEKQQTARWIFIFLFMLTGVTIITFWFMGLVYQESLRLGTWNLLSLVEEDREIIVEYWKDVVQTIFMELPYEFLLGVLIGGIVIIGIIIGTRKKRKIIKRKIKEIYMYKKGAI